MPRADLLALDVDALTVLSNRGIVKRAQAESGALTCEIAEADSAVTIRWSDEVECVIPAGKGLKHGRCSCPATTLCRHLVRSVFAYQAHHATPTSADGEAWDPGAVSDADLESHFRKADLARWKSRFDGDDHVVELVRSRKPSAYFHSLSLNVRFLVPGDLAYTHCDCAEARPCSHVPLAVWAFRQLPEGAEGGLISTMRTASAVPEPLLEDVEHGLTELVVQGVQGVPRAWVDRLRRQEGRCRDAGLVWPAEALAEIVQHQELYASHDGRFSPRRLAELVGELCIRMDAIRADTGAVPQLFVRGSRSDAVTEVGRAQMMGLGCGARVHRGGVELTAYLQDDRSGSVVAISRDFPDPAADSGQEPRAFSQLAQTAVMTGISLAKLGSGRLHIEGGKRTPSGRFLPGRSRASLNPHTFQWEKLIRAPILADDFAELTTRLAALPPASLRPRRVGGTLHVCPVAGVEDVHFSDADQALYALLLDAAGNRALLIHPYTSRSQAGMELLHSRLAHEPGALRLVAAQAALSGEGLRLRPISLVFEQDGERTLLQPWIDAGTGKATRRESGAVIGSPADALAAFAAEVPDALGEQLLLGLRRADSRAAAAWQALAARGAGLGFHRLLRPVEEIAAALDRKSHSPSWDPQPAARAILQLAVLATLAAERSAAA